MGAEEARWRTTPARSSWAEKTLHPRRTVLCATLRLPQSTQLFPHSHASSCCSRLRTRQPRFGLGERWQTTRVDYTLVISPFCCNPRFRLSAFRSVRSVCFFLHSALDFSGEISVWVILSWRVEISEVLRRQCATTPVLVVVLSSLVPLAVANDRLVPMFASLRLLMPDLS